MIVYTFRRRTQSSEKEYIGVLFYTDDKLLERRPTIDVTFYQTEDNRWSHFQKKKTHFPKKKTNFVLFF